MSFFVVFICILLATVYFLYYQLIKKKNRVQEAISNIDVQLKNRYDLLPNILKLTAKYMQHEKELLSQIVELRNQAMSAQGKPQDLDKTIELDSQISTKMDQWFANIENYPELKSEKTVIEAMEAYKNQENYIAASRRFYNSSVYELNNAVEIFPSSMIASMLSIKKMPYFVAEEKEKIQESINVEDYL